MGGSDSVDIKALELLELFLEGFPTDSGTSPGIKIMPVDPEHDDRRPIDQKLSLTDLYHPEAK